jgi:hypothetical protein
MKEDFKTLYNQLTTLPYKAHWFHTLPTNDVLNGIPSDCSDRTWVLADYCEQNQLPYKLVWSLLLNPTPSLHVAIMIEGYVYDPIFKTYETKLDDYEWLINSKLTITTGEWIRRIIR